MGCCQSASSPPTAKAKRRRQRAPSETAQPAREIDAAVAAGRHIASHLEAAIPSAPSNGDGAPPPPPNGGSSDSDWSFPVPVDAEALFREMSRSSTSLRASPTGGGLRQPERTTPVAQGNPLSALDSAVPEKQTPSEEFEVSLRRGALNPLTAGAFGSTRTHGGASISWTSHSTNSADAKRAASPSRAPNPEPLSPQVELPPMPARGGDEAVRSPTVLDPDGISMNYSANSELQRSWRGAVAVMTPHEDAEVTQASLALLGPALLRGASGLRGPDA